jgi:hypothetical protein
MSEIRKRVFKVEMIPFCFIELRYIVIIYRRDENTEQHVSVKRYFYPSITSATRLRRVVENLSNQCKSCWMLVKE